MKYELKNGNSLELLKEYPDNFFDSIVTDPPYELGFMNKEWDKSGIAFNKELWIEALRVLKPGGFLISFSSSRTYHRMAVAIEDAGFEIRDQILWIYGSGFPKSLDVSKAIEGKLTIGSSNTKDQHKLNGDKTDKGNWGISKLSEEQGYRYTNYDNNGNNRLKKLDATTEEAKEWKGWGTALKPAHEPCVLARKPLSEKTVAENVLKYNTGGINIDECRIGSDGGTRKSNTDLCTKSLGKYGDGLNGGGVEKIEGLGRWPANIIHDGSEEVKEIFPSTKSSNGSFSKNDYEEKDNVTSFKRGDFQGYGDDGNNSRFFYCAKASKKDRNNGLDNFEEKRPDQRNDIGMGTFSEKGVAKQSNHHPTVKPTDLMCYLVKLVTHKKGKVLDLFNGSGSTGKACARLNKKNNYNLEYHGLDLSQEYLDISKARIEYELKGE